MSDGIYETHELFEAALLRSLGADLVGIGPGPNGKGTIRLDLSPITAERLICEAERISKFLGGIATPVSPAEMRVKLANTFLRRLADEHGQLREEILNRRPKRT